MSNLLIAWTNNRPVSDTKAAAFLSYLEKNKKYLVPIGDFIFDTKSLSSEICLNRCLQCELYQEHNCCCGSSYSMPLENAERLNEHSEEILNLVPDNQSILEALHTYGAVNKHNSTITRGHKDGYCIFSYTDPEDNAPKCAIHKWCLIHGLNPVEYKPYICSLFPIEGIVLPNNRTVIFCSNRDTAAFTMYFYTLTQRICVNKRAMQRAISGDTGNQYLKSLNIQNIQSDCIQDFYRPAYLEQEQVLRYFCGSETYDALIKAISSK